MIVYREGLNRGLVHGCLITVLLEPCIQVAGNAPVRQGIGTVGSNVHLDEPVALQMVVLCGRSTHDSILRQYDDTVMRRTDAYLVLSANHTKRLNATELRLLNDELLVAIVEHTAQVGYYYFQTCCHIGGTTDNLLGFTLAKVYRRHMQMVGVGMYLASQHLANIESLQTSLHTLYFFKSVNFKAR